MWFLIGLLIGLVGGVMAQPYLLKAWEWVKNKF